MYKKADMLYHDYSWTAQADHDNPKIIREQDYSMLNRSEGYEMLYFINSLGRTWNWAVDDLVAYRKLEKTIRTLVPVNIRTHSAIKSWIEQNYKSFWNTL